MEIKVNVHEQKQKEAEDRDQKANNRVQPVQLEFTEAKANLLEKGKINLLK